MPITPRFSITQDKDFIFVKIAVPHIRVSDAEFLVADDALHFYCKPYLLRLRFSGSLIEDERAKAVFDAEDNNGTITLHVPKATAGEEFKDLDMLTRLLQQGATPLPPEGASTAEMKELWSRHLASAAESEAAAPSAAERLETLAKSSADNAAIEHLQAKRRDAALAGVRSGRPLVEVLESHEFEAAETDTAAGTETDTAAGTEADTAAGTEADTAAGTEADTAAGTEAAPQATEIDSLAAAVAGVSITEDPAPAPPAATPGVVRLIGRGVADGCGFAGRYHGVFADHHEEIVLTLQCGFNPETLSPEARLHALREAEDSAFEAGRYLQDAVLGASDAVYEAMMSFEPHWEQARLKRKAARKALRKQRAAATTTTASGAAPAAILESSWWDGWTDSEQSELAELARRPPPLLEGSSHGGSASAPASAPAGALKESNSGGEASQTGIAQCQLLTALVAAAYDARFTCGEGGTESAWTLAALDPCLCWQVHPQTPKQALLLSARRMLSQPYIRRWDIAAACLSDACVMMNLGRKVILRTLLSTARTLRHHEHYAILANTHLLDMIVWLQGMPDEALKALSASTAAALRGMKRDDTGWPLQALDNRATRILAGEEAEPEEGEEGLEAGGWREGSAASAVRADCAPSGQPPAVSSDTAAAGTTTPGPGPGHTKPLIEVIAES